MTSQQHADLALQRWQALRSLPPEIRIEHLMADFFSPSLDSYESTLQLVAMEMAA